MKTDLSKYDNHWYHTGASIVKRTLWYYVNLLFVRNPYLPINALKVAMLRLFGAEIGKKVIIKPFVNIKYPWRLKVGDYTWIGESVWIDSLADVEIGKNCCLSQGAMLLCGNHNYQKAAFDLMLGEIHLGDGVWIGTKSIVGPNVNCKNHSVLTVNSVASEDLEAYGIYRGNPAIKIKIRKIGKM